jgi:ubiquinone/menaquinone biosynthesis C-methylase UbiE
MATNTKWENYSQTYKIDNYKYAVYVQTANIIYTFLKKKQGNLLDLGAGFGDIAVMLAKKMNFKIFAVENVKTSLLHIKSNIRRNNLKYKVRAEHEDAYNMSYPDNTFGVGISTGYECCGAYPGVTKEFTRVVKEDGIIIMDFVNPLNLYRILSPTKFFRLIKSVLQYKGFIKDDKKKFHLGIFGIKKHFRKFGLEIEDKVFFSTAPPIFRNRIPAKYFIAFEKFLGWFLWPFFSRIIIVKFRNTKNEIIHNQE